MVPLIVDAVVVFLLLGITYALMSEGLWGAALMFFNSLFASLIAMNFYEPLAGLISTNASFMAGMADAICILILYSASLLILRLTTEAFAPTMIRFPTPVYHIGRTVFGFLGSVVTVGMLLIALDASPVEKKMFGCYDYAYQPKYGYRLDKEMLAFFQYTTGYVFTRSGGSDPFKEYGDARVFDPRGQWLINAQSARPHGEGPILKEDEAPAEGAATGGEAPPPGGAPGGRRTDAGPGIPGGTAGAAVGLAPTN